MAKQSKSKQGGISAKARRRVRQKERKKILSRMVDDGSDFYPSGLDESRMEGRKRFDFSWKGGKIPSPIGAVHPGDIKFSSRAMPDMVGLAERTKDIQVILPRVRTEDGGPYGTMDVIGGTEFLLSVNNSSAGSNAGDILATIFINPSLFTETRLFQLALLYQRYRFRRLRFWYKPVANATQSGQIIGFADYDPDNVLTGNGPENISIAAAHLGQKTAKVWETAAFPFGIVDAFTSLFVDADSNELRLALQGVYYLLAASDIASSVTALGNIYIDYEVEFYIPLLLDKTIGAVHESVSIKGDSSSDKTLAKPAGTAPLTFSLPYSPPDSLGFSTSDLDADIYYDASSGVFIIGAAEPNDFWRIEEYINFAATTTGAHSGGEYFLAEATTTAPAGSVEYATDPFNEGFVEFYDVTLASDVAMTTVTANMRQTWYIQVNEDLLVTPSFKPGWYADPTTTSFGSPTVEEYVITFTKVGQASGVKHNQPRTVKEMSLDHQRKIMRRRKTASKEKVLTKNEEKGNQEKESHPQSSKDPCQFEDKRDPRNETPRKSCPRCCGHDGC